MGGRPFSVRGREWKLRGRLAGGSWEPGCVQRAPGAAAARHASALDAGPRSSRQVRARCRCAKVAAAAVFRGPRSAGLTQRRRATLFVQNGLDNRFMEYALTVRDITYIFRLRKARSMKVHP